MPELKPIFHDHYFYICGTFSGYKITEHSGKLFLSWQTWDLMFYGFKGLCKDVTTTHPGYTIYPIKINGSAVETFFSQVKHVTSGHLSSTNYATARGSVITKGSIHGKLRRRHEEYGNAPLYIRKHSLQQKPIRKNQINILQL